MKPDLHWRLEPEHGPVGNLQRGFQAELADPLWLLGRQWQMGEHQGENASTPLHVEFTLSETSIDAPADRPGQSPAIVPGEAIIEGGPNDAWPLGRRIAIGLQAVSQGLAPPIDDETDPALVLTDLPEPYAALSGRVYDGSALARTAGFDLRSIVPTAPARASHWMSEELSYRTSFPCGDTVLRVERHDGGDVDWWTVDAARALTVPGEERTEDLLPNRFRYPGAPLPRYWQIEEAQVDIGGFPPDRSHFATLLLIDLIASHSDDWFAFPVVTRAGCIMQLSKVTITDSFGDRWPSPGEGWEPLPPDEWSLFRVRGLDPALSAGVVRLIRTLAVWPTAATPLSGPPVEEVVLGVDEDSNLLWAVEQRVNGRDCVQPPPSPRAPSRTTAPLLYRPTSAVPYHWHPYEIREVDTDPAVPGRRRFVQGRFADLHTDAPSFLRPAPLAEMLQASTGVHEIEPSTVPTTGLRLQQRFMLARGTDGLPVLWVQRQRLPLLGGPSHMLRFDLAEAAPPQPPKPSEAPAPVPPITGLPPPPADPLVSMVQPAEDDDTPPLTPEREALGDPPTESIFDPAQLPGLSAAPGVIDSSVMLAQALLNAAGALPVSGIRLIVDGEFGSQTREAVSAFQTSRALPVTGEVDGETWSQLLTFAPAAVLLPTDPAPAGPPIARVQAVLNRIGARPLLDVNGRLDGPTSAALSDLQAKHFLVPTGGLDPPTWAALAGAESDMQPTVVWQIVLDYDAARIALGEPLTQIKSVAVLDQLPPAVLPVQPLPAMSGYWLELWDDVGFVLYRQFLEDIIPLHYEALGESLEIAPRAEIRGSFSLTFPKVPRAVTLAVYGPPPASEHEGERSAVLFTIDLTAF
jgi:peptidoglycan hydrolase-like protein with peptidoglycan-binding domain